MSKARQDSAAYVIVYAAIISAVFTAGIMALHAATRGMVQRNERLAFQKAMVELFDLGEAAALSDQQIVDLYDKHIVDISGDPQMVDPQTGQKFKAYSCTDVDGTPVGLAFSFTGTGFWARIDGLIAVSPDFMLPPPSSGAKVLGIAFLAHQETPGLGGRITERQWRRKFIGLDLSPPQADGQWIYIGGPVATDPDSPRHNRRVDAITGATGTCSAVEKFLNEQLDAIQRIEMVPAEGKEIIPIPF